MKIKFLFIILILSGCSHITYEGKPDGTTLAEGWEIGTTKALSGVKFSTDGKIRSLQIDSLNKDQIEGLKTFNEGLKLMIEGAAKAAK
jgi:hypothetical protein